MTIVVDFVSRRTIAPFIMLSRPPSPGTNPNTTIVLEDITGPALKREERYSRTTTTGRGRLRTIINVDGEVMYLQAPIDTISDFETLRQQMPTSTLGVKASINYNSVILLAPLLALSALKTELLHRTVLYCYSSYQTW